MPFDPDKLSFVDCELVKLRYDTHPMLREPHAPQSSQYDLYQAVLPIEGRQTVFVFLKVSGRVIGSEDRVLARVEAYFRVLFVLENFAEVITHVPEGGGTVDADAMTAMLSIAASTMRGQLQVHLAKSPFGQLPLPVLTIAFIRTMPGFKPEEILTDWIGSAEAAHDE